MFFVENRPDLKSNRMLARVQDKSLKAIKRQYAPDLTADLTWGYTRNETTNISPFQVGASMGLGSINPVGIHYQIREGEAYLDIANHNVNIAKQDIYWEVQENYINMRQLERMQIETSVSEADIGKIKVGQIAKYTLDGYQDKTFEGKVTQVRLASTTKNNVLSFGFSGLVGIGFGYYPAYKASLLNPIDALRYE